ncbi:IS1380 family transposase [Bradyrhizobium sp.]|uniref:IS1380 family transposase n=1 Tax=Bradyrhizobium sp. TaxID=376 RepID=UPI0025BB00E1|nr:IS1380 family transposase [Bradyrhizobium sp.]MBV8916920.1 IS1380 family transposase [Bradyrhizobium sp.]
MSLQSVPLLSFDFLPARPVEVEVSPAPLTSDAGLVPIRQFDERIRLTEQFAAALDDRRDPALTRQSLLSMVRQRVYGILADYEDQNDHDTLRTDPVFKLLADRLPDDPDLASQPTLSRFENAVSIPDLWRLRDVLVDLFIQSFDAAPGHLTLDIDAFDDPAHGHQQLIMFHGYYEQYQYLPIVITCAENDLVLLVGLRHGTCHASLGADNDLRYLMGRLRAVWPDLHVHVRGDSGLGVPRMYDVCRELRLSYTFGIGMNATLRALSEPLLAEAVAAYERTGQPQRSFLALDYQAGSWPAPQPVIIKVEAHAQGTNRRAVVTNRPGCAVSPQAVYDEYALRGESENRNKELKTELKADRLSDHRFLANFFRLYLHAAALNLLVRLRHLVVQPAPTSAALGLPAELPTAALDEPDRKQFFNTRRARDPLGEGFACTWRTRLIKVAAEVITRARRVIVRLSGSWPHLDHFLQVSQAVNQAMARPSPG